MRCQSENLPYRDKYIIIQLIISRYQCFVKAVPYILKNLRQKPPNHGGLNVKMSQVGISFAKNTWNPIKSFCRLFK